MQRSSLISVIYGIGFGILLSSCSLNPSRPEYDPVFGRQKPLRVYGTSFEQKNHSLLYFDQSLERLQQQNYDRHPSPKEACNLVFDGLEGRLTNSSWQHVSEDMQQKPEWVSMAFQRLGKKLIVYKDPEGIVWNGIEYTIKGHLWHSDQKEFFVTANKIPLANCPNTFLTFVYGKTFQELPEQAKHTAVILLPEQGKIMPVRRFDLISLDGTSTHAYSRGIKTLEIYRE